MEYIPSNDEDAALHKKFHNDDGSSGGGGVDLGKGFMRSNASRWVYEATRFDEGYVVIIDRKASPTSRNQAKKVLEVVNRELSAPEIEDEVLWSQTTKEMKYRVFLHMKGSRCVGLCLAERIWECQPVERGRKKSIITVRKDEIHPAIVGISRVWTSGSWRRKGIAMDLLDCVVSNFIYGMEISKDEIAFTQPTESGRRLAEAFFGNDGEWHVYDG